MRSRVTLTGLGVAPALLILVAGCGGGGDTGTTPEAAAPPPVLDVPFSVEELTVGDGNEAITGYLVAVSYTAWMYEPNASENKGAELFTVSADVPWVFRVGLGEAIRGVDQALEGMRVGGVRRAVIPPDLGFGSSGTAVVPGNATLLVEIELLISEEVPFGHTDLEIGTGAEATAGTAVSMVYQGWLFDLTAPDHKGALFDSNTAANPFSFTLGAGEVIVGWDLGIPGMRVGGRRQIIIPHQLAYGTSGRGTTIPGFATLLFEVELLSVE